MPDHYLKEGTLPDPYNPRGIEQSRAISERSTDVSDRGVEYAQVVPPGARQSRPQTLGRTESAAKRRSVGIAYLVPPLIQPNWNSCWHTGMLMLERWRDNRLGLTMYHADLESIVFAPRKVADKELYLYNVEKINEFTKTHGMGSQYIKLNPQSFEGQLRSGRPFAYIGMARNGYQHTLVVTGMVEGNNGYYITYNDPDPGRSFRMPFFDFLHKHPPAFSHGLNEAFIVYPLLDRVGGNSDSLTGLEKPAK